LLRCQFFGVLPDASFDVLSREPERYATFVNAAKSNVDMRMLRVPVDDRYPFELRSKISLHSLHQIAHVLFQIEPFAEFGRDD
jgi:hypothetical protein